MSSNRLLTAAEIRYYDTVTVKHKDTKQFLHSHIDTYPLRYEDGRISSQGRSESHKPCNSADCQASK